MPAISSSQAILIGSIIAPIIFALCAYFTSAGLRRIAGGLISVLVFILVQYTWDRVAGIYGWWSYPAYHTYGGLPMPAPIYLFSGLVYGGFGLIGWRIARRFGWKGLLFFLAAWSLWGFIHDVAGSSLFSSSQLMVIESGIIPRIIDLLVYATCMVSVLLSSRVVGGSFRADSLARTPR